MRTYKRYTTRLYFEPGQRIPQVGDAWIAETALGGRVRKVKLLKIKKQWEHPQMPGVTLMDAYIGTSAF
ncbi:MAG TPA: hypothetical protein VKQ30_10045 [Ktedonobacterales bacterium]|nr:hypothetical protein [Ktedonobacterales bacterium]